jgi:replicative DNA helicase
VKGPELEQLLVGAVLSAEEPWKLFQAAQLHPDSFADPILRVVWDLGWAAARRGEKLNAASVVSAGMSAKVLRAEELISLQTLAMRNTLDAPGFIAMAREFRQQSLAKVLGQKLVELGKELQGGATPAKAQPRFKAIHESYDRLHAEGRRGSTAVVSALENWERRQQEGKSLLVTSGLPLLDEHVGGLPPKLCVIVGKPGIGKSALLAAMVEQQLRAGLNILFFSLEDGDEWFIKRHMALRLGIPVKDVGNKPFPDKEKAALAAQELGELSHPLHFVTKSQVRSTDDVIRIAVQHVAQHGVQAVWLDNATSIKHVPRNKFDEPRMAAGRMYEAFADFADQYRLPFVALAHTTRDYEKRTGGGKTHPVLSDISETADAERAVRMGLGLWKKRGAFRVTVLKVTEAQPDVTMEFDVHHEAAIVDATSGRLVNLAEEARKEKAEKKDRTSEEQVADSVYKAELRKKLLERKKLEEAAAAAKNKPEEPEPPPQLELIPGGKPEETKQ